MKYAAIFAALLAVAGTVSAQGRGQPYIGVPERCLVVSGDGPKFKYRDSWIYSPQKRTFKDADLWDIAKQDIHVVRLEKNAPEREVRVQILKCQHTYRDIEPAVPSLVVPVPPCCCEPYPRFIPITYAERRNDGSPVGVD